MNNKLEIAGKTITIDIEALSKGLCKLHEEDEGKKAVLAFGMLDAQLIEIFENNMKEAIQKAFSPEANELFKQRIDTFINHINNEVTKGVYKYATMVV